MLTINLSKRNTGIFLLFFLFALNISAQQKSDFIYRNDFSAGDPLWETVDKPDVKTYTKNGICHLENLRPEKSYWSIKEIEINQKEDFEIETSVKRISGSENYGHGLTWGTKDGENAYFFCISSNGFVRVHMYKNGVYTALLAWKECRNILGMNNYNKLSIRKTGNEMRFFINGTEVYKMESHPFFGNWTGFYTEQKMMVDADYLYIRPKQKEKKINLIENYNSFGEKIRLDANINSPNDEKLPVISADEKTLYVDRADYFENTGAEKKDDVYFATLNPDSTWSKLKNIGPPINNDGNNFVISVSADNNTLLLGNVYSSEGKTMSAGYSICHRKKNGWEIPKGVVIKNYVNESKYNVACLSHNGKVLIIAVWDSNTFGEEDLYVSFLQPDNSWSEPKNMGNVLNTFSNETTPFLASDDKTLYFSSSGHPGYGSNDIFMSRRLDDTWKNWSEPKNLGPKINGANWDAYYTVPASGKNGYMVSSTKGNENLDVFKIKQPESAKPLAVAQIHGYVYNSETKQPLGAKITWTELGSEKELGSVTSSPDNGYFNLILPKGKKYSVHAVKEGFISVNNNTDISTIKDFKDMEIHQYLTPIKQGQSIIMNNLFFTPNQFDILPESEPELASLLTLMKGNPTMKIEISGHTSRNAEGEKFNQDLSTNRAQAVKNYLVKNGIADSRIKALGFGCSKPLFTSEEESLQAKNRRVEFKIMSK